VRRDRPPAQRRPSPYPKADLTLRGLARLADLTLAFAVATTAAGLGPLLAAGYLLLADGLFHGQSPGKKIFGVRAVVPERRTPAGWQESALRNVPFAVAAVCWAVPLLWPVFFVVGLPAVAWEAWRTWDDPLGLRLGDLLAETQVVDGKVLARPEVTHALSTPAPAPPGGTARVLTPAPRRHAA
jgi:uncharacterized RDD family membrane protein YckC